MQPQCLKHILRPTKMVVLLIALSILVIVLAQGLYQKSTNAVYRSRKRLQGKTVIVTGGTAGIGLRIATDLADRGARVIIACPDHDEGTTAVQSIKEGNVVFKLLDLSSLESIRRFAADIIESEEQLHILVNNAGVGAVEEFITDDGMSFIMQVNYFGQVLLTLLLLPLLKKSGTPSEPARILNTSSFLHYFGTIDFEKLNNIKRYYPLQFYANSKFCLVLFCHELAKRLRGSNVIVNCVDPGLVGTRIYLSVGSVLGTVLSVCCYLFFKTPWEGAQTALYVALDEKVGEISGGYFKNCQLSRAKQSAYDDGTSLKLWEESIRLIKLSNEGIAQCFT